MMIESSGQKVLKVLLYVFLIIMAAIMLLPFLWMLSASLKQDRDVFTFPIQWIPAEPEWGNYSRIWTQIPLLTYILNTVKLTIIVTLLQLFTSSFAAYAFAKLRFKGHNALFLGYIATIAVPWQAYMVPQFMMLRGMGLNNTHLAIIILQAFSAFGVFMMKQFYEGIPTELCEAARIDGASHFLIFRSIVLPVAKPIIVFLSITSFTAPWMDFIFPKLVLRSSKVQTVALGLFGFVTDKKNMFATFASGSLLIAVPFIIFFVITQKMLITSLGGGAVKE